MSAGKPKTVLLHLGTYKTATTFLQQVLFDNFKNASGSVYYPRVGIYGTAHHYLATPAFPGWTNGVTQAEYHTVWKQLSVDITHSDADYIIISSEMLCSLSESGISYIKETLEDYPIRAIIYFRRQDQYISSLAAQLVKGCNGKPEYYTNLNKAIDRISTSRQFDYGNMCAQWARVIGEENLIVRPFERTQLYNETILADFFHHSMGMPVPDSVTFPTENLNPRLCRDALEFKQLVNRLPVDRDTMNDTLPGLFAYSEAVDAQTKNTYQEHVLLSPSQRLEIIRQYADVNRHIAATYLGRKDGILFTEPVVDSTVEWTPYPGLSTETMKKIVQSLNETSPDVLKRLTPPAGMMDKTDEDTQRLVEILTGSPPVKISRGSGITDFLFKLFNMIRSAIS